MLQRMRRCAVAVAVLGFAIGCGDSGAPATPNPVPVLEAAEPTQLVANSSSLQLRLHGSGFTETSRVTWKGTEHAATLVSANVLEVTLDPADLAVEGTLEIAVVNPAPGGGTSATVTVPVGLPKPIVTSVTPTAIVVGDIVTLTIDGSGFVDESLVSVNGIALPPTPTTPTRIVVDLPESFMSAGGTLRVLVSNRGPAGGTSAPVDIPLTVPVPVIYSFGVPPYWGSEKTLYIHGRGFVRASVVYISGVAHETTWYNGRQLSVVLTDAEATGGAPLPFQVITPAPGGGSSNILNLTLP